MVLLILFLAAAVPVGTASAGELLLDSETVLHGYSRETALGEQVRFLPLFETLGGAVDGLGGNSSLSLRFSGWGRVDLGEATGEEKTEGDLTSAYLEFRHPTRDAQARAGRFYLVEGTAAGYLDGVFAKAVTVPGIGVSLFGGKPGETAGPGLAKGSSLAGGRVFARFGLGGLGAGEAGIGVLTGSSSGSAPDRRELGGDLWLKAGPATLMGEAVYDREASEVAWHRAVLRLAPAPAVDLALATEGYGYAEYLSGALSSAFAGSLLDPADEVQVDSAQLAWQAVPGLTLLGTFKRYDHRLDSPGDARRGELGTRIRYGKSAGLLGFSLARVQGDAAENEYQEARGFVTYDSRRKLRLALEALSRRYEQALGGGRSALHLTGSAGYLWSPGLDLSGDLRFSRSPALEDDLALILRVRWELLGGRP